MAEDLDDKISENAEGPKKATVDGVSVEQHGLADQIAADRYLESKKASRSNRQGIRITKLVPPGAA